MHNQDSIQYALETTNILYEPDRRIETFGSTRFTFQLLSELMDSTGTVRIRTGEVEANRPQIVRPEPYEELEIEGFGEEGRRFFDWMHEQGHAMAFVKYGFQFRRGAVREELVHESMDEVRERVLAEAKRVGDPMNAVIEGVDDAWEVCVLRFAFDMVRQSCGINEFDFRRRGLL